MLEARLSSSSFSLKKEKKKKSTEVSMGKFLTWTLRNTASSQILTYRQPNRVTQGQHRIQNRMARNRRENARKGTVYYRGGGRVMKTLDTGQSSCRFECRFGQQFSLIDLFLDCMQNCFECVIYNSVGPHAVDRTIKYLKNEFCVCLVSG